MTKCMPSSEPPHAAAIPAQAITHAASKQDMEIDTRLHGTDGKEHMAIQLIGRLLLIAKPIWS
jgi:hypothetical protein